MFRKLTVTFAAAGLLVAAGISMAQQDRPHRKRERIADKTSMAGQKAPAFKLVDLEDNTVTLEGLKGQIIVLEWANKDCPVWRDKMKELEDTFQEAKKMKGVTWLAIDSTHKMEPSDVRAFNKEHKITRTFLDDRSGTVGHAYRARTTPHMFIIDGDGKVAYDGAIDNQKEGKDHVNYVTKALKELTSGKTVSEPTTKPYGCSVKYAGKPSKKG